MSKTQRHSMPHKFEMLMRRERHAQLYEQFNQTPVGFVPASLNRRTMQPHAHSREIARNLSRSNSNG